MVCNPNDLSQLKLWGIKNNRRIWDFTNIISRKKKGNNNTQDLKIKFEEGIEA